MKLPFTKRTAPRLAPAIRRTPAPSNGRRKGVAALAVLVALGAFLLNLAATRAAAGPGHPVVVAKTAIPAGATITPAMVTLRPVSGVPHVLASVTQAVGQQALTAIPAGTPLVPGLIGASRHRSGLTPSQVGVWVPVTLATSGLAQPHNRVDVIFTSAQLGSAGALTARTSGVVLLDGALVLAVVGTNGTAVTQTGPAAPNPTAPAAVELAVPRREAPRLVEAEVLGTLTLVQDPWATTVTIPVPPLPTAAPSSSATSKG